MEVTYHAMIDVETMGTESDAAPLSLAAVVFHPSGRGV
jgi:hypothetical protein